MFDLTLYLAFPLDQKFDRELSRANPHLVTLLTSGGDYLSSFEYEGRTYLGKPLSSPTLAQLEVCENHLISLLRKLTPTYSFTEASLLLVTLRRKAL